MTTDTPKAEQLIPAALSAYRLTAELQLVDDTPLVALQLKCPHKIGDSRWDARVCVPNLLKQSVIMGTDVGDLVQTALMHDDAEPTIERARRIGDLHRRLGDIASYTLSAEMDEYPFLAMNCPYAGGRCPGSVDSECCVNLIPEVQRGIDLGTLLLLAAAHEDARYGVPIERLIELRQRWITRQRTEIYTRETADGPSAGLAGSRADLYGQLIAELDKAMVSAQ
jgi:hypothetical protein